MNKKIKTQLNKKFRIEGLGINSRTVDGCNVLYSAYTEGKNGKTVYKCIGKETQGGGTLTPFNIQCNCAGAPAIRNIIKSGDNTFVVFGDGDRVALTRHEGDKEDPVTAVLWALGIKVFGKNLSRQIHTALKYRLIDGDKLHAEKKGIQPAAV